MTGTSTRYPARSYDRDLDDWTVTSESRTQTEIAREVAHCIHNGITVHGGPLREQLPDGSDGPEGNLSVSVVWSQAVQPDGSRRVLGWYECGRG